MRKLLVTTLALVALIGTMAPGAFAQPAAAPAAPPLTFNINGFLDTISSASWNLRDANFTRTGDKEWYARNRGRINIEGRAGTAVFVWGIEIDSTWGQVSGQDNNLAGQTTLNNQQRSGTTSAFDLNTDVQGSVETKWLFAEFDAPLIPFATRVRLGAQPYSVTYKICALACSDFAGVNLDTKWSPNITSHLTFAQIEEGLSGPSTGGFGATGFNRGDDFAFIASLEVTPFKGLDIRPIYSYAWFQGATSSASRQAASNGVNGGTPGFTSRIAGCSPGSPNLQNASAAGAISLNAVPCPGAATNEEQRHTVGVDLRWRSGPFSLEPTALYQFGKRDTDNPFPGNATQLTKEADISAFLFDVKAGWRIGPALIEFRGMYTSGNRPKDQLSKDVNYYQPITGDTGWWSDGWGNITALGIDYFNGAIKGMGNNISIDRYGRQQFGLKATYSFTPQLDVYALAMPVWTARSVDTDGTFSAATINCRPSDCKGDSAYVGTEANIGTTWRFAPGLTFDLVGAYLWAGDALDTTEIVGGVATKRDAKDVYTVAARLRLSF
jgi:hypothetical protein